MDDMELRAFVQNELPSGNRGRTEEVLRGLISAGDRYERYAKAREQWQPPKKRKDALEGLNQISEELLARLGNLDPISKDGLKVAMGEEGYSKLQGYLNEVRLIADGLARPIRTNGRPRDLSMERWIHEVADIYENHFGKEAKLAGGNRGKFYELLSLSMPESFPRYGSLDPRQVKRVLSRRNF